MKSPKKHSRLHFYTGLTVAGFGLVAVLTAIIFNTDWSGYLFVGGIALVILGILVGTKRVLETVITSILLRILSTLFGSRRSNYLRLLFHFRHNHSPRSSTWIRIIQ